MGKFLAVAAVALSTSLVLAGGDVNKGNREHDTEDAGVYDFTVKDIDGDDVALSRYKGDVLLIVNVASK